MWLEGKGNNRQIMHLQKVTVFHERGGEGDRKNLPEWMTFEWRAGI
jgi:hypothetical protein